MGRIRTIKPEYFTDGKVAQLSDACALFFIALWTQADDYGYWVWDNRELSLKAPRWGSQAIVGMVSRLARLGLVRVSREAGVGLIVGWDHQRIRDKRASKWKDLEIKWDDPLNDAPGSVEKTPFLGKERKGREGKGSSGGLRETGVGQPALIAIEGKPKPSGRVKPEPGADSRPTWDSYCAAYKRRYGAAPVRNATVNGQMANFIKRVGAEEAPLVAEFYVFHNDAFYVRSMHSVGILLKDAEKIRTEWVTGNRMNAAVARDVERRQNTYDAFAPFITEEAGP